MVKVGIPYKGTIIGFEMSDSVAKAWGLGTIRSYKYYLITLILVICLILLTLYLLFKK